MLSRRLCSATRSAPLRSFSSSAAVCQAPIPPATKPASQSQPSLPPVPKTQLEQIRQYPAHPLLQFFRTQRYQITDKALGGTSATEVTDKATSDVKSYVELPQSVLVSDLAKDSHSRAWLASELRLKSSADLHTLWYVLLMERNRLATAWEEIRRVGLRQSAHLLDQNLQKKTHRVQKSMARIKLVLNERRLALIAAQQQVRSDEPFDPDTAEYEPAHDMPQDELFEQNDAAPSTPSTQPRT